jgi:hypothetical protein
MAELRLTPPPPRQRTGADMKSTPNLAVERFRLRGGPMASSRFAGNNGAFLVPFGEAQLLIIVSDGLGWDHVSVSLADRCPTWAEMAHVKDLFFDAEECVVQFHPPRSTYIDNHEFCLHLWRSQEAEQPMPPSILVGIPTVRRD